MKRPVLHKNSNKAKTQEPQYALLTTVAGRWKAEIIEDYLKSEGIEVVLVEEAISHLTHVTSFASVQIYIPKVSLKRARSLLETFNETRNYFKGEIGMANKKKIEERLKAQQAKKTERTIRWVGGGLLVVVAIGFVWVLLANRSSKVLEIPSATLTAVAQSATQAAPTPGAADTPQAQSQVVPTVDGNLGTASSACDGFSDIPVATQYSQPPMKIDTSKQYFATVKMAKGGEFVIQLYPDKAPITVNSFVFLACKGFYNGVTFHRVLEGFMAQGGDPTGTGTGGPGYQFVNEKNDLTFDQAGVVAMANSGPNTNGSQFFIMFGPYGLSENDYTIFGQVVQGMDVVNGITRRDPNTSPSSAGDAMESVTITMK